MKRQIGTIRQFIYCKYYHSSGTKVSKWLSAPIPPLLSDQLDIRRRPHNRIGRKWLLNNRNINIQILNTGDNTILIRNSSIKTETTNKQLLLIPTRGIPLIFEAADKINNPISAQVSITSRWYRIDSFDCVENMITVLTYKYRFTSPI